MPDFCRFVAQIRDVVYWVRASGILISICRAKCLLYAPVICLLKESEAKLAACEAEVTISLVKKIREQRGMLQFQALGYVNSAKLFLGKSLERKPVFRDVRIKANLDLMF